MYHAHNYQITVKVKPRGGVIALHTGHGRVYVESISGNGTAIIRYDSDEGMRSPCHTVPLDEINFGRAGLTANGFKQI